MTKKLSPKLLTLIFSVLVLCFLATIYIFAWTEPSVAPPGGNVATPLNTSSTAQTKTGRLTFTEFYDSNNTTYYVNPAGTTSAILSGRVGIGTTSPAVPLHVAGGSIIVRGFSDIIGPSGLMGIEIGYYDLTRGIIRAGSGLYPENTFWPLDIQAPSVWVGASSTGTPPPSPPSPYYSLEIRNEDLGTAVGNQILWQRFRGRSANNDQLRIFHNRYAAGTDWSSAEIKIQKTVDTTDMHYISFKGLSDYTSALTFGFGTTGQMAILQNGNVGIGRSPAANRLEVEGNASKTTAGSWLANSDIRIKTDIQGIRNALDVIGMLHPVRFRYSEEYMAKHPSITDQYYYNFIAQDFQRVFPAFVQDDGEGYLQIDTYPVTPYLVAAVQELNKTIEQLKAENNELKKRIEILENK